MVARFGGDLSSIERYLLDVVSDVARRDLGQDWGPWRVRDSRDGSGLRVDVTFEDSGVALELTSLQDSEWLAANSVARKFERELTVFARERRLHGWVLGVSGSARLKDIAARGHASDGVGCGNQADELQVRRPV